MRMQDNFTHNCNPTDSIDFLLNSLYYFQGQPFLRAALFFYLAPRPEGGRQYSMMSSFGDIGFSDDSSTVYLLATPFTLFGLPGQSWSEQNIGYMFSLGEIKTVVWADR